MKATISDKLHIYVVMLFLCFSFLFSRSVLAERSDVDSVVNVGTNQTAVASVCSRANDVSGKEILVYTPNDGILSFSNKLYADLDMDTKREFMEVALKTTKESGLGAQAKNKMYNFIEQQDATASQAVKYLKSDTSADLASARAWFRPFSNVFSTIVGIFCCLIFLFLSASISWDIAYLVLPGASWMMELGKSERTNKPIGVSREAVKSKEDVENSNEYKNVISVYMKRRLAIIFVCCLCLGYVISGQIFDILIWFIDVFTNTTHELLNA